MSAPEVSVVIPTLNRWALVSHAVAGVLAQEDVALELIVVDDGSSDGTSERLAALGDPRLRVLRHERPMGVARARNDGLAAAAGRWTAFLDDDDYWAPRKLREQVDAAEAAGAALAYSAAVVVDGGHEPAGLDPAPPAEGLAQDLMRHNSIPGGCSNVIAPTALLHELGGFDERLSMLADWDLWIRLARSGPAARCEQPHVAYLDHGASMHVQQADLAPAELAYLADKHPDLVEESATPGSGAWFMLWTAAGQYRAGRRWRATATYLRTAVRYRSEGALLRALAAPFTDRYVRRDAIEQSLRPLGRPPAWLAAATPGAAPAAEPPAWRAPAVLAMAGWALAGVTGHVRAGGALERRLVGDLGMPPADAQVLLDRARARLGGRAYARRALASVIAANAVARRLLPADVRRRAIMPLAVSLLATQADGLAYVGLLDVADEPLETRGMLPR